MDAQIQLLIQSSTNSKEIVNSELIQALWSGYGSLIRVETEKSSYIIKQIKFPTKRDHPKGWNSNLSHLRKVQSYKVEINWYKYYNENTQGALTAKYIQSQKINETQFLILEDLKEKGFTPKESISSSEVHLCLRWLAIFHAKHLNTKPNGLWNIGSYWHLETRPDELEALCEHKLKELAPLIDRKLNSASYQSIVHGDAKLANFLFKENQVSAVDFQYVGGGVGVKDVAYFLTSIYDEEELFLNEEKCLDYYFKELKEALEIFQTSLDPNLIGREWRELYPYAACDFYRFLKGWSPTHYKLNKYSKYIIEKVQKCF